MNRPVEGLSNVDSVLLLLKKFNIMAKRESEDYYNEETYVERVPDDGNEEIDIEPIDWDDM